MRCADHKKKGTTIWNFIYCNVILESFFISNGWFLNENVEEKTVMLSCYVRLLLRSACVSCWLMFCVCVWVQSRGAEIHFSNILHLICIKCLWVLFSGCVTSWVQFIILLNLYFTPPWSPSYHNFLRPKSCETCPHFMAISLSLENI